MKTIFKKSRLIIFLVLPVVILLGVLGYYQLFYKSPVVDSGIAKLERIFGGHHNIVTAIRFSPNDSLVITSSVDSTIKIWERSTGKIIRVIKQPHGITYLDLSTDGKYVVTGSYDSIARIWLVEDGTLIKEFKGHSGTIWTVAFSIDGTKIASSGDDETIRVWDVATGSLLNKLQGHKRIVWSVKFSPDGKQIASGSFDFTVKLWDLATSNMIWNNEQHNETVVDLAFSHDGKLLATTSDDKTIKLWNMDNRQLVRTMKVPEHVQAVAFSPDDKRLMTGGRDKPMIGEFLQNFFGDSKLNPGVSARLWDVASGKLLQTFSNHTNDVMDIAISHDGKWIGTASADKTVELWKMEH